MRAVIEPFTAERGPAVAAFNRRLAAGGAAWRFPEDPVPDWLPPSAGSRVFQEYFLLVEGEEVRGAYILKHRDVSFRGAVRRAATIELPLSEGTIDRAYAMVAYQLLSDALRREPLLFGVGMGGEDVLIARLVRAMRWRLRPVSFHFRVVHGTRFFRQLRYLRTTRFRSLMMDAVARSGLGWVAAKAANTLRGRRPRPGAPVVADVVDGFDDWADEVWHRCRAPYSFVGVRDRAALNRIYGPNNPYLLRLRIAARDRVLGYAVVEDRQMVGSEYFGDLRIGTIMDGFGGPEDAERVVRAATRALELRGVDLVVSNQSHAAWVGALRASGFFPGPTTFLLGTAPPLTALLDQVDPDARGLHLNRGDGPWPWGVEFRVDRGPQPADPAPRHARAMPASVVGP